MSAAEEEGKRGSRRGTPGSRETPWLVFPTGKNGKGQTFCNLSEPNNKIYRKNIPELRKTTYWQSMSHQGWLIIVCDERDYRLSLRKRGDCFLWNPETFETIQLPNVLRWIEKPNDWGFRGFVLSSPPNNSSSIVSFVYGYSKDLVYCYPGKDKEWRTLKLRIKGDDAAHSLFCFKGKIHIQCYEDFQCVVEKKPHLDEDDDDDESLSVKSFEVSCDSKQLSSLGIVVQRRVVNYVQSSDKLFQVMKHYYFNSVSEEVVDVLVFEMDFSELSWKQIHTLDDHVLFLGKTTTASCSAAELGVAKGCVYYIQSQQNTLFKFDIECKTISVSLPFSNIPTPWSTPEWISMPSNFRITDERRKSSILGKIDKDGGSIIEETSISCRDCSKKSNGGELKQTGAWATLNANVIGVIASYLRPVDHLHFRAVCKENQSAIPAAKWRMSSSKVEPTTLPPWFVFSRNYDTIYNFVDPMHNNERYFMNLAEFLLDSTIRFSKGGWLLMSRGQKSIFFFNPFTRETIHLPDLPGECTYMFAGISFSSLPTSPDCKIFAFDGGFSDIINIFSISRGDDKWYDECRLLSDRLPLDGTVTKFLSGFKNPVFYKEKFYFLDHYGTLLVFYPENFHWEVLANPRRPCDSIFYQCYLVECEGKLLSVFVGHSGKWVRVFRLDSEEKFWVEVKSLQKNMLFISNTSCLSAIAPNTSMGNRIYFPRFHDEDIMFFSLDTSRYHFVGSQHSTHDFYNTEEQLYCSWIEPNWSKSTVQELNWFANLSLD